MPRQVDRCQTRVLQPDSDMHQFAVPRRPPQLFSLQVALGGFFHQSKPQILFCPMITMAVWCHRGLDTSLLVPCPPTFMVSSNQSGTLLSCLPAYPSEFSTGDDLHRVLWLKSRNSEIWLERRTNYTRSTGVMSMVGYLLGLGDRHPSNLMLDRFSGKLLHIDFGDCFEVLFTFCRISHHPSEGFKAL